MSYDDNPYYNPEKRGLTIVAEGDDPDASYSFDMFVVWTDGESLFYAQDSGCSCPSPFEDVEPVRATKDAIYRAIDEWVGGQYGNVGDWHQVGLKLKSAVRDWRAS